MIPNIAHFLYGFVPDFGGKAFSLVHFIAVKSAYVVNNPDCINFYYKYEPTGEWWERAKRYLNLVKVEPPTEISGSPLRHPAHQADVVRLQVLLEFGGIYLDIDTICMKPLTPLLQHQFVLGQQGINGERGLGNAVILSEKGSSFAAEWLNGFDPRTSLWHGFRSTGFDEYWAEYSVRYPAFLANLMPEHIHVEKHDSFYWPLFYQHHLKWLFEEQGSSFENAYCHHLWETLSWKDYLENLSLERIRTVDTNFHIIVRRFLADEA